MSGRTSPPKAGRWRRRVLVVLFVGPVLLLVGTNLILGSGWGRERVARKISEVTGFQWTVGGASWSPWGGVKLTRLEGRAPVLSGPDPGSVFLVEEVRVRPYWTRLLGGKPEFRDIVVESPVGEVPVELLAAMTPARRPVMLPTVQDVPAPQEVSPEENDAPTSEEGGAGTTPAQPQPESPRAPVAEGTGKEAADDGLPGRLKVRNGRVRLYSLKSPTFGLQVEGIQVDVPIAGPEARGAIEFSSLAYGETALLAGTRSEVHWKRPVLTMDKASWECAGVPLQLQAEVMVGGRMRSAVELSAPPSALQAVDVFGMPGVSVGAGRAELLVRLQGELLRPAGWEGSFLAGGHQLGIGYDGQQVLAFDHGRLLAFFRGGVFHVSDGRLVGETFSILGNGAVHYEGGMLGVVRVVADWEYATAVSRAASGLGFNRGAAPWLTAMETPDRYYRDLHIEGRGAEATVDVGRNGEKLVAEQVLDRITRFAQNEKWEEDHGEGHDPRWDSLLLQQ